MRFLRKLLIWAIGLDLLATLLFWGGTRFVDQSAQVDGGVGVVFFTDNTKEAAARIEYAVRLLKSGKVDRLLMLGGHRPQEGRLGSQDMALIAARGSGMASQISAEVESRDTISGLHTLAANSDAIGDYVFVSNCMHLLRAKAAFQGAGNEKGKVLGVCPSGGLNPIDIWRRAHYEAGAWTLFLMPESWRETVLDTLRGADPENTDTQTGDTE